VDFENNTVKLPKIGEIKAVIHKTFEWKLKTATISKSCTGNYYINILVEDEKTSQLNKYFLNLRLLV
jgi:putative transposase